MKPKGAVQPVERWFFCRYTKRFFFISGQFFVHMWQKYMYVPKTKVLHILKAVIHYGRAGEASRISKAATPA